MHNIKSLNCIVPWQTRHKNTSGVCERYSRFLEIQIVYTLMVLIFARINFRAREIFFFACINFRAWCKSRANFKNLFIFSFIYFRRVSMSENKISFMNINKNDRFAGPRVFIQQNINNIIIVIEQIFFKIWLKYIQKVILNHVHSFLP